MDLPKITKEYVEEILGEPFENTAYNCHGVSLSLVRAMPELKNGRVARGWSYAVMGQHSWVVLGDPYDSKATIVDATLWSYDTTISGVAVYPGYSKRYMPHGGRGTIFDVGSPTSSGEEIVEISDQGKDYLDSQARDFLNIIGPLDVRGWNHLANSPIKGWPSRQILSAMWCTPELAALCPFDVIGMLTDFNPGDSYW